MTYTLYNRPGSGGFVVEAALTLAEASFELVELGSKPGTSLPEEFKETNPWGQLPTLILPDGSKMTESSAMLIHIAAAHPEKGLAPHPGTPPHAKFLRWTVFAGVNLYEAVARRGYPFRYTDDEEGYDAVGSASVRRMGEALAVVEAHIDAPFLLGEDMCLADIYLAMFSIWHMRELNAPRLAEIAEVMRAHAVIGPIWRRHFGDR